MERQSLRHLWPHAGQKRQPLPQLEVKIADPVTGDPVALHESGEICCRGYQNMLGYYGMAAETAAAIDPDGWLHMGDIGATQHEEMLTPEEASRVYGAAALDGQKEEA